MAEFPAMPLWTDRYLADCEHLSDAEHGRYLLMIMHLWRAPNRRFPNDDAWLARKFKRTVEQVETEMRPLIREFFKTSRHHIWHKVVDEQSDFLVKRFERQSTRAKKRWDKANRNAETKEAETGKPLETNETDTGRGNAEAAHAKPMPACNALSTPTPIESTIVDSSVPNGTGASAPNGLSPGSEPDLKKLIYDRGKALMGTSAGGLIAKALSRLSLGVVAEIIETMESVRPVEPKAWFQRAVDARVLSRKGPTDGYASAAQY